MKVSFLVPDLAWPIVGIAVRMAKYICHAHEVEIVGTSLWGCSNPMYSEEFAYRSVPCPRIYRYPEYFREVRKLSRAIQGDVIITMKAFGSSLPAALLAKRERGSRVVAYLDEWDGAVAASWSTRERLWQWAQDWAHPCNNVHVPRLERRLKECDVRLVTTRFLQQKFAGRLYPIGVDTDFFRPQDPQAVAELKRELGLSGKKLVVFGGVARPHKGLEVFAQALVKLGRSDVALVILGRMDDYVQQLMRNPEYGWVIRCPAETYEATGQIHRNMPLYLGMGDVLIVPLADTLLSRSQMPCKVFEAMAMAKPIVASAVSDLPEVLAGCGRLVPPDKVQETAHSLDELLSDPAGAARLGKQARDRCMEHFAIGTSRQALLDLLAELQ